ncbi:hypothetical protein [Bacillus sp. FJAT-45066]|uniref:hypothetical protein n=1 Tax=Bacillus sp. FJAT-45066 TaxID=2011010 RepID=UPI000BB76CF3|nr:hypothetical protein [Bacillus sp. FJAT-45066]
MSNMTKVKKAVLGTALAGAIVAGAGFGTYSWFTGSTEAHGVVDNAIVEITGGGQATFDYSSGYLAPSRSQIAEGWKTIANNSTDIKINLDATFTGKLYGSEGIDFSQYRSAAIFVFNEEANGVTDAGFIDSAFREYLEENDDENLEMEKMFQDFYGATMHVIYIETEEDLGELEETLADGKPVMALMSNGYIQEQLAEATDGSGDAVKVLEKGLFFGEKMLQTEYVHVLFGTALKDTAGNAYQSAKMDFDIHIAANQVDRK